MSDGAYAYVCMYTSAYACAGACQMSRCMCMSGFWREFMCICRCVRMCLFVCLNDLVESMLKMMF